MISVEEARACIRRDLLPLQVDHVPLWEAFGRVLAEDLTAQHTHPSFASSAMDGYAVRASDINGLPTQLTIVGRAAAGERYAGTVGPGEAVRIFTGAPLPDGTDAVIASEDTKADGIILLIQDTLCRFGSGRHVRPAGIDFASGDAVLSAGRRLGTRDIGLAAAMNRTRLPVYRRPRVGVLSTGNELTRPGDKVGSEQIVDSTGEAVCALVRGAGAHPVHLGIARDNAEATKDLLRGARGIDLLVTIGGVSAGDYDVVLPSLTALGFELGFHRVALQPGKPVIFGRLGLLGVLGLPGNPVAALICTALFLRAALDRLEGQPSTSLELETAWAGNRFAANGQLHRFQHGRLANSARGPGIATLSDCQDTSVLSSFARADCLIVRPPGAAAAAEGDPVQILRLSANPHAL
jgi:molybdopterin molybdotransferase